MVQVVSHACAKAAMFLGAGLIAEACGHDRINDLGGAARILPVTIFSFTLAGVALIGLPPSGGFVMKSLLKSAAGANGLWWWGLTMDIGGLLTAAYLFRVLGSVFLAPPRETLRASGAGNPPGRMQEGVVLALALIALLLGLLPASVFGVLGIGGADINSGFAVSQAVADAFDPRKLWSDLWPILLVGVVVVKAAPWRGSASGEHTTFPDNAFTTLRNLPYKLGAWIEQADGVLRRWPVAGFCLLLTVLGIAAGLYGRMAGTP